MDHPTLKDIQKPIKEELSQFESYFKQSLKSKVALLDKIMYYIVQRKGKQVRPMFIFLAAKMCGQVTESTYVGASLVELLHTATLVHDDVVDDSYERRGFCSVNALWKNKIAVLVGDYFLSKGLLLALDTKNYNLLHITSTAVKRMSEGELLQMEKARKLDIDEVGAASTTDDAELIEKMRQIGEYIGISFQIKDDLFDYGEADIGKPRGIDIKERKMTLPLIYTLNNATSAEKKWIINIVKNHNEDRPKVDELIKFIKAKGGIKYTEDMMYEYKHRAFDIIKTIENSEAKTGLIDLVNYITERNY